MSPLSDSTNDLALSSRAYYWTAAAIQSLRRKDSVEIVDAIKVALTSAADQMTHDPYRAQIALYQLIIDGTQQQM